ncbi:hypothetical protein [Candidatus Spongiisocius sp.]|uniref:hypothetical protein n=1 Tax=Candidatus Spongiisocius sp. TaxID=3101273 RepID=UPI003B58E539
MTARRHPVPAPAPAGLRVLSGGGETWWRPVTWVIYTVVAVAAFLAFIFLRTAVDEVVYEISNTRAQIQGELERKARLEEEKRGLQSPWEIVPIAERMLGMELPDDVIPVYVADPAPVTDGEASTRIGEGRG